MKRELNFELNTKTLACILFILIFNLLGIMSYSQQDTLVKDTIVNTVDVKTDTVKKEKKSNPDAIKAPISYEAKDSMRLSMKEQKVYLYGSGVLKTEKLELQSELIQIDMDESTIYAVGRTDSMGVITGKPVFKDDKETFNAATIKYNFKSKKGIVTEVKSEQHGGFLHGQTTKMHPNKEIHILDGKYTTCDLDHPHFYVELTKAKVIPQKKIISGPLYFVILDIPIYVLALPFGYFPSNKRSTSGFIIPQYGEENRKGFFLEGLGYYLALNDNFDVKMTGDVYSKGSMGAHVNARMKKRYKYNGDLRFDYVRLIESEKDLPDYQPQNTYSVNINYMQDPKARPNSDISVSIHYDKSYRKNYTRIVEEYANSTTSSSASYRKTWPGTPFNFSANMSASQNMQDSTINLRFPTFTFNMNRISPLERKEAIGNKKWYEKIGVSFSSNFDNQVYIKDSLLFTEELFNKMKYGYRYSVPISTSFSILKYVQVSPSFDYKGRLYPNYIIKRPQISLVNLGDSTIAHLIDVNDTIQNIRHSFDFQVSIPFSTKLYGLVEFKKLKRIKAIRHVFSPSVSYSWRPDFAEPFWNNYDRSAVTGKLYSYDEIGIFGKAPEGKFGSIGFSFGNNFEMKMKTKKDTADSFTKIKLLESLNFGTSYNLAADSLRWSNISMSGGTRFFENITVNFSANFDPYQIDSLGKKINRFEYENWEDNHKLARFNSSSITVGFQLDSKKMFKSSEPSSPKDKEKNIEKSEKTSTDEYDYFNFHWNVSANYSLNFNNTFDVSIQDYKKVINQSLNVTMSMSPTPKWKVGVFTGYDFSVNELTSTRITIARNLHCWEMSFTAVPFGKFTSYSFRINIGSSIFSGLEYKREKRWQDNY